MMKRKLLFLLFCFPVFVFAQGNALFSKKVYTTGEDVSVKLLSKTTGTLNGISGSSDGARNIGTFTLGKAGTAGLYRLDFVFSPTKTETYNILVLPDVDAATDLPAIQPIKKVDIKFARFLEAATKYWKDGKSRKVIMSNAVSKYIAGNSVNAPVTVFVCISWSATAVNPVLGIACAKGTLEAARAMSVSMLEAINEQLYADKYLTKVEFDYFKINLSLADFAISLGTSSNQFERMLALAQLADSQGALTIGASYGDQFFKKYQFILKYK